MQSHSLIQWATRGFFLTPKPDAFVIMPNMDRVSFSFASVTDYCRGTGQPSSQIARDRRKKQQKKRNYAIIVCSTAIRLCNCSRMPTCSGWIPGTSDARHIYCHFPLVHPCQTSLIKKLSPFDLKQVWPQTRPQKHSQHCPSNGHF